MLLYIPTVCRDMMKIGGEVLKFREQTEELEADVDEEQVV
jgi:hypothetical protein